MLRSSSFQEAPIREAETLFKQVQYSPRQRQLLIELAGILHQYIPISELALRGFLLRAAKEYQMKYKKTLLDVEEESKQARLEALRTGFGYVENYLTRILKNEADKGLVSKAIQDSLSYYIKNYK